MRILMCSWRDIKNPAAGGAERYTHEVLRRWGAWGHDVTLLAPRVEGRPDSEDIDGVTVLRFGGRYSVYRAARRYISARSGTDYDVVVDQINTRPFACQSYVDAPVVGLVHQVAREIWFREFPWPVALAGRYWFEPRWLRSCRGLPIVAVSDSTRASLAEHGIEDVSVIPPGLNLPQVLPAIRKEPVPTVAFLGRLVPNKRPEDAVAAFAEARRQLPEAQMWILGTGPLEERLRKAQVPGVHVFGHVTESQKFELLSRAHVVALTSTREGWSLVVDEAAAVGTPAIGYNVAGLRESVPAARGWLVPPTPAALAGELAARLPDLVAAPARSGWRGGALDWDTVARLVLERIVVMAGISVSPVVDLLVRPAASAS